MSNKSDLFNGNKPTGSVSRNGFDGSAARIFSMRPAICRPVFYQHTVPNSSYKISAADIVRTDALQTAAFLRGKHELDFYFVPYSMLYSAANNVILKRGDDINPALDIDDSTFPSIDLAYLVQYASLPYIFMRCMKLYAGNFGTGSTFSQELGEFMQGFLGYEPRDQQDEQSFLHLCIYNDLTVFEYSDLTNTPSALLSLEFIGSDILHLLASCGYGDFYQYFKTLMDNFDSWFEKEHPDRQHFYSNLSTLYFEFISEHVDSQYISDWDSMEDGFRKVNLISLCAYQKIWNDNYRDSVNDINSIYNLASSMDWDITGTIPLISSHGIHTYNNPLTTFLRPRARMYKKDLSSGLYPSTQYGDPGSLDLSSVTIVNDKAIQSGASGSSNVFSYGASAGGSLYRSDDPSSTKWTLQNTPSAYDIKYTLALQKYREMLLRAGNRTKDVLRAEFGVKSAYIDEHYSRYLGSFDGSLDINKVTATAETGDYSVGDLAGNVFSSLQGNTIEFTCNDYGIVMAVMSFFPEPVHNAFGIDAMNMKTVSDDFYHEAFANLGLQPVSSLRFSPVALDSDSYTLNPVTLGFAARDIEYKQNLDLCFDGFVTSPIFTRTFQNDVKQTLDNNDFIDNDGVYSNYVVSKPVRQSLSLRKNRCYFLPSCMDTLFKSYDDGEASAHHFQVALQISMSEVLPMPVTGMNL